MEESQEFLSKCRKIADDRFDDKEKADAEYMRIGKALVAHLHIERLGAMEQSMIAKANKFLEASP